MEPLPPSSWTVRQVTDWLQSIDLAQYKRNFESLCIDGSLLFEIKDEDLETDLGIKIRLHRVKILEAIKKLMSYIPPQQPMQLPPQPLEDEDAQGESDNDEPSQVHAIRLPAQAEDHQNPPPQSEVLVLKAVEGLLLNNIYIVGAAGATLGRHTASNDIVVSESFVSRRHCDVKFVPTQNRFVLMDVGSTTGTFLMLQRPQPLALSLMFQMGLSEFKVKSLKPSALELEVFEGPAKHSPIKVSPDGLTIGRDPENTFSVREDSQMSSHHGRIYVENGVFLLEDVGSTNKTWVRLSEEGVKSRETPLAVGDVIKVGTTVLTVLPPDMSHYQSPVRPILAPHSEEPEAIVDMTKSIPEERACKICYARESDSAFYPCGHMYCRQCASQCKKCPTCRKTVSDIVRLFNQ